MPPLKYFSNFWRTLAIPLINCEHNLILTWSTTCVVSNAPANQATTFAITNNIKIDRKNVFDHPVKSNMRTYDNIGKIATG